MRVLFGIYAACLIKFAAKVLLLTAIFRQFEKNLSKNAFFL